MQAVGTFEKARKQGLERTFGYLGASSAWSVGLFLFFFYILSCLSFLTDAVLLGKFEAFWLVVSGAGFLPPLFIGAIYRFAFLNRRREKPRPVLNLLVAGLAGSSRNLSVGLFALWSGLDNSQLWGFRFVGGFIMGVGIYALWSIGNGTKIEYLSSLKRLAETQGDLSSTRANMSEHLAEINQKLQDRTKQALLPQLSAIKDLLGDVGNFAAAAEHLRVTITDQIRPMMKEISQQQPKPFEVQNLRKLRTVSASLPARFTLRDKIMLTWSSVLELLGLSLWLLVFGSKYGLLDIVILFFLYFFTLGILKFLIPEQKQFRKDIAISITLLISLIASSVNVFYIFYFLESPLLQALTLSGFALLCGMIGPVILLQFNARAERRNQIESQITEDLLAIAKENSLFAQRLWVFRKRWLLVLHGNVQSSLTAALTRLQTAKKLTPVLLELVKQDLRRAEIAVESNLNETIDLDAGLKQLQEVWDGICDVKLSVSERARRALARSHDTSFCVNELVKEAVSNAVRHGEATNATVSIDRISDDMLHVEVSNNGSKPTSSPVQGIGTEMLNEISLQWSLVHDRKLVRLVADLPVKL